MNRSYGGCSEENRCHGFFTTLAVLVTTFQSFGAKRICMEPHRSMDLQFRPPYLSNLGRWELHRVFTHLCLYTLEQMLKALATSISRKYNKRYLRRIDIFSWLSLAFSVYENPGVDAISFLKPSGIFVCSVRSEAVGADDESVAIYAFWIMPQRMHTPFAYMSAWKIHPVACPRYVQSHARI